jgi:hypothetical protein
MKPLIPIDRAVLCANCDRISDSLESRTNCIGCGSAAIALVEKLLAGAAVKPSSIENLINMVDAALLEHGEEKRG